MNTLYPKNNAEDYANVMNISDCSIGSHDLIKYPNHLAEAIREVWGNEAPAATSLLLAHEAYLCSHAIDRHRVVLSQYEGIPDPQYLYNMLIDHMPPEEESSSLPGDGDYDDNIIVRGVSSGTDFSPEEIKVLQNIVDKAQKNCSLNDNDIDIFILPNSIGLYDLKRFVDNIDPPNQITSIIQQIYSDKISPQTSQIDPYPNSLTEYGVQMVALGLSSAECPFYFNHSHKEVPVFRAYFDVSGSMADYYGIMSYIAKFFDESEECEMTGGEYGGKYIFTTQVTELNSQQWQSFKNGTFLGGGGTSFARLVDHIKDTSAQNESVLIFTDGMSHVPEWQAEQFNQNRPDLTIYPIYIYDSPITSCLDKLNGKSFSVIV